MSAGDLVAGVGLGPPAAGQHPIIAGIERWLAHIVGVFAAIAVVAEVGILLLGVIFRFGLNQPLVWSDELASIVFLWLAMLGSVYSVTTPAVVMRPMPLPPALIVNHSAPSGPATRSWGTP